MIWELVCLTYRLLSPLHIGYHKVGNVQRTRYYVPARNLWGAITEQLTRRGFAASGISEGDYRQIGVWVQQHMAFSYFFMLDETGKLLAPCYGQDGIMMGDLPLNEFERCYLDSHVTTALDAATTSAEQGSLHEIEYLAPYPLGKHENASQRMRLRGWIFLDMDAVSCLGTEEKWQQWLGDLSIGGERRYGFGRIGLAANGWQADETLRDLMVERSSKRPRLRLRSEEPLLAHTLVEGAKARGMIEPLVGRETYHSQHFGMGLTQAKICWVPGSVLAVDACCELGQGGYWKWISED